MFNFRPFILSAFLFSALTITIPALAQEPIQKPEPEPPKYWHLMDLKTDGYFGISLKQAYLFVKGKQSKTVVVATLDSGIDTLQNDLKSILWVNKKEIAGNGIDDDHNGYVDDIHGWNFLGGQGGKADFNE